MSDYKKRLDELVNAIQSDESINSYDEGYQQGFEDGKRAKWISIKDELPLNDQWVLCFVRKLDKSAFALTEFVVLRFYDNNWYTDEDLSFNDKCFEVTHFMLLNTPPKEQE